MATPRLRLNALLYVCHVDLLTYSCTYAFVFVRVVDVVARVCVCVAYPQDFYLTLLFHRLSKRAAYFFDVFRYVL